MKKWFVTAGLLMACAGVSNEIRSAQGASHNRMSRDTVELDTLPSIIVSASRRPQLAAWVSEDFSLIKTGNIASAGYMDLGEMIQYATSASINGYGGGTSRHINLRGAGAERTLILVDGVRAGIKDGELGDLSPEFIDRIEIVEGGQSSLYGMDAVGGIINIITKEARSKELSGDFTVRLTSFQSEKTRNCINGKNIQGSFGKKNGTIEWISGLHLERSDGAFEYADTNGILAQRSNNDYENYGFSQKARLIYGRGSVTLSALYGSRSIGAPGTINNPAPLARTGMDRFASTIEGGWAFNERWTMKLNGNYTRGKTTYDNPDPLWPSKSRHIARQVHMESIQELTYGKQHIVAGVQAVRTDVQSTNVGSRAADCAALSANAILISEQEYIEFQATPAIRGDYSTVFKGTVNGKLGIRATVKTFLSPSLLFNIGTASRAPDFNSLYWLDDGFSIGNPHLRPESGYTGDAGIDMRYSGGLFSTSGRMLCFYTRLKEMIVWQQPYPNSKWSPFNVSRATIYGAKVKADVSVKKAWKLQPEYTYLQALSKNDGVKRKLIYRPAHVFLVNARYESGAGTAGVAYRHTGKVFTDAKNTDELPGYGLCDITVGRRILSGNETGKGVRLLYQLMNIGNVRYAMNQAYPMPGREHRLSVGVEF